MVSRAIGTINQFWASLPLHVRSLALLWIPLPVLLAAGAMIYRAQYGGEHARIDARDNLEIRRNIHELRVLSLDAESSVRKFAGDGDVADLGPYWRWHETWAVASTRLRTRLPVELAKAGRWKEIDGLAAREFELVDEFLKPASDPHASSNRRTYQATLPSEVERIFSVLQSKLAAMDQEQQQIGQSISDSAERSRFRLLVVLIECAVAGIFFQMLGALLLAGAISGQLRTLAANAERMCQGLPPQPVAAEMQEIHQLGMRLHDASCLLAKHERELRDSEARFRAMFWEAPIPYQETDRDGVIRHVNAAECSLLGVGRDALLGKHAWETVSAENREAVRKKWAERMAERSPTTPYECEYECADRSLVTVEVHENLIRDEQGCVRGIRSALLDVTARKMVTMAARKVDQYARELKTKNEELLLALAAARAANATKSRFLAAMSHELRTPLNGIIGLAELMFDGLVGPVADEHREYLGDILSSSRHLLQLVNDVLDLAKVESGKMAFHPEAVEVAPLLHEVRNVLQILAERKRISLTLEVGNDLGTVVTDAARFRQIAYNYLSNAIKFTPEGGRVYLRALAERAGWFRLEVEDTGPGITDDDQPHLFKEFHQLDAAPKSGTGLGLALTKKIVEGQGGRVGVQSAPGTGSVFFAVLPSRSEAGADGNVSETERAAAFLSQIPNPPEVVRML